MVKYFTVKESYKEYLQSVEKRATRFDREWVRDIIDRGAEQENVLYRDQAFILLKDKRWRGDDIEKLHLLAFSMNKNLRTIRDLTGNFAPLLMFIRAVALDQIEKKYHLGEKDLNMCICYDPTTYYFHIHFVHASHPKYNENGMGNHMLDQVILNILLYPYYYQTVILDRKIWEEYGICSK